MQIMLKNVRLSFPNLFKPRAYNDTGEPAFSASFLFSPTHEAKMQIENAIKKVAQDKWPKDWQQVLKTLHAKDSLCLHDGDMKADKDGYPGKWYVSARNRVKPTTLDAFKNPVSESDGVLYGGCFVNASIDIWAQDNKFGKRICATLRGVMFHGHGEAFGGSSFASVGEFADIEAPETDTEFDKDVPW